jgi:hypothetical protein
MQHGMAIAGHDKRWPAAPRSAHAGGFCARGSRKG